MQISFVCDVNLFILVSFFPPTESDVSLYGARQLPGNKIFKEL